MCRCYPLLTSSAASSVQKQLLMTDLVEAGSMTAAKEAGKVRSEGKEYIVQDGDVMLFRFNV